MRGVFQLRLRAGRLIETSWSAMRRYLRTPAALTPVAPSFLLLNATGTDYLLLNAAGTDRLKLRQ